ncbi:MAG: septum formation protein Maf [Bacteroidetes bacterium HGW-Bacteroidetes-4]|nr:MAG: septum formation protein Maf [Bacteroidetes bacterium HGW-Bacteroidetes-4]
MNNNYQIILASQSPRRQQLLKELGLNFTIEVREVDEVYPMHLQHEEIPVYLAQLKAKAFENNISGNQLVITADTIVWLNNRVLGKPSGFDEAFNMLRALSGNTHTVYTGVCLKSIAKETTFWAKTDVHFKTLSDEEITFYLNTHKPYDKAGAYGIQEWIGYIGIEHIEGSYFNVMGLPVQKLYEQLKRF